jgi:hypothetical protein
LLIADRLLIILINQKMNWFEKAFHFSESTDYSETQKQFVKLYNGYSVSGISTGTFNIFNHKQLKKYEPYSDFGKVTLSHIVNDIIKLHKNPKYDRATFQVASQFNCLEMCNPGVTPEDGITIYQNDNSQGPLCAICTPAGLVYREYLYDWKTNLTGTNKFESSGFNGSIGQNKEKQIDNSLNARRIIYDKCGVFGYFQNGYLFYTNGELNKINVGLSGVTKKAMNLRRQIRESIDVGVHTKLGVCIDGMKYKHSVNHVYCSGLPINYNNGTYPKLWEGLSEIFLESAYENTLSVACLNNIDNNPCFITMVGGGAYGMNKKQINRAIKRACILTAKKGGQLNVFLVHHKNEKIHKNKIYYGNELFKESVWG